MPSNEEDIPALPEAAFLRVSVKTMVHRYENMDAIETFIGTCSKSSPPTSPVVESDIPPPVPGIIGNILTSIFCCFRGCVDD